ncbi:GNAT family N-acetyltransferase [Glycomyces sp. NPDC048151]|uniref:GNAT family N-acetyltransferase n=1 Tax=Glycomyces sp. NPDC048151 TaxID=3364002 RepID=UPI003723F977
MNALPPWPTAPPAHGGVVLRRPRDEDAAMARELATDPYVPTIGTLPAGADEEQALAWVRRQLARYDEDTGFSFTIADAGTGAGVGQCGLWLRELPEGRATAGYSVAPSARGRGFAADALKALTAFGWTVPGLFRIALYIEPWNTGSVRTAERAGYAREGLLRSHQEIAGVRRDMLLYAAVRAD